jgi:ribosomal-protein-alanine N-acetyltransferase
MDAAISWARQRGCERIDLEVSAGNASAIALYTGAGFEVVGRRPGYYSNPREDALLMSAGLSQE